MGNLFKAPTSNFFSTTLNGAINDAVQTITLTTTTGLQAPGYIVVNRQDSSGTDTPSSREVISFTGISGSDLTGCTRAADGSTARSHSNGAIVESNFTVGMWNNRMVVANDEAWQGLNAAGVAKELLKIDADDHFVLGQLLRLGGHASNFSTAGTTEYTSDNFTIQCGSVSSAGGGGDHTVTVTFPIAFSATPIVIAMIANSSAAGVNCTCATPTASAVDLNVEGGTARTIFWIAIGPK